MLTVILHTMVDTWWHYRGSGFLWNNGICLQST